MKLLSLLSALLLLPAARHDFHISKGLIEYKADEQSLQMTFHVFIDDLEKALEQSGAPKLYLGTERESARADDYLKQYLQKHFQLTLNGKPVTYTFLGKEISKDLSAFWLYLEAKPVSVPQRLHVRYDVLTEVYADQKNLVNLKGPGGKTGVLLLDRSRPADEAEF